MTARYLYVVSLFLIGIAVLCPAKEPILSSKTDHDGSTKDKAIIITAPLKKYVDEEWTWIRKRYPDASLFPGEQGILIYKGRYIDSMTFATSRGQRTMYFDISGVKKQ